MLGVHEHTINSHASLEALLNFLVMFVVFAIFDINDLLQSLNTWSDTSTLTIAKIFFASLVTTLIFYGYNRKTASGETTRTP